MYAITLTHEYEAGKVLQKEGGCEFEPQESMKVSNSNGYSYVPFGKGTRMCAGKNYGILFMKYFLFEIVRTFDFKLKTPLKFTDKPMTKPLNSVIVELTPVRK